MTPDRSKVMLNRAAIEKLAGHLTAVKEIMAGADPRVVLTFSGLVKSLTEKAASENAALSHDEYLRLARVAQERAYDTVSPAQAAQANEQTEARTGEMLAQVDLAGLLNPAFDLVSSSPGAAPRF